MLKHRLRSGLTFSALMLAAILMAPWWILLAAVFVLTGLAQWECLELTLERGAVGLRSRATAVALGAVIVAAAIIDGAAGFELVWLPPALAVAVMVLLCNRVLAPSPKAGEQAGGMILSLVYVAFCMSFLTRMFWEFGAPEWPAASLEGRLLVLYLLWTVKLSDTGAYAVGTYLGKRKLCPLVSPAKTLEGLLGGIAAGLLASIAAWALMRHWAPEALSIGLRDAFALGIFLPLAGAAGDLCESMLKRSANLKDSGRWLPGMGGLLDVVDSVLFAAPVLYFYLWWAG